MFYRFTSRLPAVSPSLDRVAKVHSLRWIRFSLIAFAAMASVRGAATDIDFNRDVRPILSEHCFECHGPDQATREADLRLDTSEGAWASLEKGDATESVLVRRLTSEDPDQLMPPADSNRSLSPIQIQLISDWIAGGATFFDPSEGGE